MRKPLAGGAPGRLDLLLDQCRDGGGVGRLAKLDMPRACARAFYGEHPGGVFSDMMYVELDMVVFRREAEKHAGDAGQLVIDIPHHAGPADR